MKLTGKKTQFLLKLRILKWVEKRGESSKKRKKKEEKKTNGEKTFVAEDAGILRMWPCFQPSVHPML